MVLASLLATAAFAAPRDRALPHVSPRLRDGGDHVVVLEVQGDEEDAARALEERGIAVEITAPGLVQARVAAAQLSLLEEVDGLVRARPPHRARPKGSAAEVKTEALASIFDVEDWHATGIEGQGVRVAVLDVGFASLDALLGRELPRQVRVHFLHAEQLTAHGTAVAEVVHDIAPAAELWLFQFYTDVEFLALTEELTRQGFDVVNASIGFDNVWPADGTSPMSEAVDALVAGSEAVWTGAAGNENDKYRVGALTDADGDGALEIDGLEGVWIHAPGGYAEVSLRWSEPMTAAEQDVDLVLAEPDGTECARSTEPQDGPGSSPYELVEAHCGADWLLAVPVAGPDVDLDGLDGFLYGADGIDESAWSETRNLTLPADARHGIAVGACDPDSGEAPYYTSRGPTEDGRIKPDVCTLGKVSTASFGPEGFAGTSASAPHAAGLAALIVQGFALDEAESVGNVLRNRTSDLGLPGVDPTFGKGALHAGTAPALGCGCATGKGAPVGGIGFLLTLFFLRRRTGRKTAAGLAARPANG